LYKVSGGVDDWAYDAKGFPYSYTVELPDKGKYGFVLDKSYIVPVCQESSDGMRAFSLAISDRHGFTVPPTARQMQLIKQATAKNAPGAIIPGQAELFGKAAVKPSEKNGRRAKRLQSKKIKANSGSSLASFLTAA